MELCLNMKTTLGLLLLACVRLFGAAPESLAGKVYRSYQLLSGITNAAEDTIIYGNDGRYIVLKEALGVKETLGASNTLPDVHWGAIVDPSSGGRYQYEKTSETAGVLTVISDNSTVTSRVVLLFSSATTGSTSSNGLNGLGGQAFYLSDLSAQSSAPLANVSLRGHVAEGRPLIMGFVVPGNMEREILIRVVGSSLAPFGVTGAWSNSSLQIFKGNSPVFGDAFRFPYWSDIPIGIFPNPNLAQSPEAGLRKIFNYVGAFSFPSGSKDSAVVIRLSPGNYTVIAGAATGDPGGEALIELYPLP